VGDTPNADDPCDDDENNSAEERRRNSGGWGAVLGRGIVFGSARVGAGEVPGTASVGELDEVGTFLENSEEDRARAGPGGVPPGARVFERVFVTGDRDETCESIGWDCEIGMGETGEDVVGVSLEKVNDDGVQDEGVTAGEVVEARTPRSGGNSAVDVGGRLGT
jgi:hypothetical protein